MSSSRTTFYFPVLHGKRRSAATLVIVTGPGGNLSAGIGMGLRVRPKKLIVGVMGMCASSCALIWIGGETGRKFLYQDRPGVLTCLCFHQASQNTLRAQSGHMLPAPSGLGNASINKYLADLGYNQDMIEWATTATAAGLATGNV